MPANLAGSVVTNSDVLVVNAMTPLGVPVNAANPQNGNSINLVDNSGVPVNRVVLATLGDCSAGELFQKSNNANSKMSNKSIIETSGLGVWGEEAEALL